MDDGKVKQIRGALGAYEQQLRNPQGIACCCKTAQQIELSETIRTFREQSLLSGASAAIKEAEWATNQLVDLVAQAKAICPVHGRYGAIEAGVNTFNPSTLREDEELAKARDRALAELAELGSSMKSTAQGMYQHLNQESHVIDCIEDEVIQGTGAMDQVMKRMAVVLKTNNRRQLKQVLYLTVSLFFLVILLLI